MGVPSTLSRSTSANTFSSTTSLTSAAASPNAALLDHGNRGSCPRIVAGPVPATRVSPSAHPPRLAAHFVRCGRGPRGTRASRETRCAVPPAPREAAFALRQPSPQREERGGETDRCSDEGTVDKPEGGADEAEARADAV